MRIYFSVKKNKSADAFLPLAVGIAFYFIYAIVFMPKEEIFSDECTSSGFICGSLSAGIFVFIKNLKNGNACGADALIELLSCYVDAKKAKTAAVKIKEVLRENLSDNEITEKILSVIYALGINAAVAKPLAEKAVKLLTDKFSGKDKR